MFYCSRVELMSIAPLRFHVFNVFYYYNKCSWYSSHISRCENMAEKGCLLWEVEENCNCAKEHKNAQTIIIIIIIIYLDNIFKRGKRGLQSRSTKSHKRFACMITQTGYEFYATVPLICIFCVCELQDKLSVNLSSNSTYRYQVWLRIIKINKVKYAC